MSRSTRRIHTAASPLIIALMVAMSFLLSAPMAHAADGVTARFTDIDADLKRGQLTLAYKVHPRSWKEIRRAKIAPRLNLYEVQEDNGLRFMYSFEMRGRAGSVTFPKEISFARGGAYELIVVGYEADAHVDITRRKGVKERTIQFVRRGRRLNFVTPGQQIAEPEPTPEPAPEPEPDPVVIDQPPRQSAAMRAKVVETCNRRMPSQSMITTCIKHAKKYPDAWAVETIETCRKRMPTYDKIERCLDLANRFHYDPTNLIDTCRSKAPTYDGIVTCMEHAAGYTYDPSEVVETCRADTNSYDHFDVCISMGQQHGEGYEAIVKACSRSYGTNWISCMKAALTD